MVATCLSAWSVMSLQLVSHIPLIMSSVMFLVNARVLGAIVVFVSVALSVVAHATGARAANVSDRVAALGLGLWVLVLGTQMFIRDAKKAKESRYSRHRVTVLVSAACLAAFSVICFAVDKVCGNPCFHVIWHIIAGTAVLLVASVSGDVVLDGVHDDA